VLRPELDELPSGLLAKVVFEPRLQDNLLDSRSHRQLRFGVNSTGWEAAIKSRRF